MRNRRRVGLVIAVVCTLTALPPTAAPPGAYLPPLRAQVVARVPAAVAEPGPAVGGVVRANADPPRVGGAWPTRRRWARVGFGVGIAAMGIAGTTRTNRNN